MIGLIIIIIVSISIISLRKMLFNSAPDVVKTGAHIGDIFIWVKFAVFAFIMLGILAMSLT
jgi:hypothetical protein